VNQSTAVAINDAQLLTWIQIVVSLLTLAGLAFTAGRIFERLNSIQKEQGRVSVALFGEKGTDGAFLRRSEAETMLGHAVREHEAFDRRLGEFQERLGALEARSQGRS